MEATADSKPIKVLQLFGIQFIVKPGTLVCACDELGVDHRCRVLEVKPDGLSVYVEDELNPDTHGKTFDAQWDHVKLYPSFGAGRPLCRWPDDPPGKYGVVEKCHYPDPVPDDDLSGR